MELRPFDPERDGAAPQSDFSPLIDRYADEYQVPKPLARALFKQESSFNPNAVNAESGATGLGQLMPDTAGNIDRTDPEANIKRSLQYLREGYDREGTTRGALTYYYGGPDKKQWGPRTNAYPDQVIRHVSPEERVGFQWGEKAKEMSLRPYDPTADGPLEMTLRPYDPAVDEEPKAATPAPVAPPAPVGDENTMLRNEAATAPPKTGSVIDLIPQDQQHQPIPSVVRLPSPGPLKSTGNVDAGKFDFETAQRLDNAPMGRRIIESGSTALQKQLIGFGKMVADGKYGEDSEPSRILGEMHGERSLKMDALNSGPARTATNEFSKDLQQYSESIAQSIATNVPTMGLAVLGAPATGLVSMGLLVMGDEYADGKSKGLSGEDSVKRGAWMGAFEVLGEMVGIKSFAKLASASIRADSTPKDILKALAAHIPHEMVGEQYTTAGQFLTDKLAPYGLTPDATLGDYLQQVKDTFIVTAGQTMLLGAGGMGTNAAARRWTPEGRAGAAAEAANAARDAALAKWAGSPLGKAGEQQQAAPAAPVDAAAPPEPPPVRDLRTDVRETRTDELPPAVVERQAKEAQYAENVVESPGVRGPAVKRAATLTRETGEQHRARLIDGEWVVIKEPKNARPLEDQAGPVGGTAATDASATVDGGVQGAAATPAEGQQGTASTPQEQGVAKNATNVAESATVDEAAHAAATSPQNDVAPPTDAQAKAGNYLKGHTKIAGLDISIENPAGSKRRPEWPTLQSHYGYIRQSEAADGDHVDTFIKAGTPTDWSGQVFVVDQVTPKGKYDEAKVMMGFDNLADARQGYVQNYTKDWKVGDITPMSMDEFKAWVKDPALTKKPAADVQSGDVSTENVQAPKVDAVSSEKQGIPELQDYAAPRADKTRDIRKGQIHTFDTQDQASAFATRHNLRGYTPRLDGDQWLLSRPKPVRSPAQLANDRLLASNRTNIRPTDNALRVLAKAGGMNREELTSNGIDEASFKAMQHAGVPGRPAIPLQGGLSIDGAAEVLAAEGFDVYDESGSIDAHKALEILHQEFRGEKVYSPQGQEHWAAVGAEARAKAEEAQLKAVDIASSGYDDLTQADREAVAQALASLDDMVISGTSDISVESELTEDAFWRVVNTYLSTSHENLATSRPASQNSEAVATGTEGRQATRSSQAPPTAPSGEQGVRFARTKVPTSGALELTGETEAQIKQREALEKKAADEKRKKDNAPDAKDFTLTGSDRAVDVAEAKGQTSLFARQAESPVVRAVKALAENGDLFRYPVSQEKSLAAIAKDVDPDIVVTEHKPVIHGDRPDLIAAPVKFWVIKVPVGDGFKRANAREYANGTIDLDVSGIGHGKGGSAIYHILANFAHNNDLAFIGDTAGFSDSAMYRRLENMLSSALKFGTTRHIFPHARQLAGATDLRFPALAWEKGNDAGNLKSMIETSVTAIARQVPTIKELAYNFERRRFEDSHGKPVSQADFDLLAQSPGARAARAGRTTLERTALLGTLLRRSGEEGWAGILGEVLRQSREKLDPALQQTFYARAEAPERGLSHSAAEALGQQIVASWANPPDFEAIKTMAEAPAKVKQLNRRMLAQGAEGQPYAFFHEGTIYVITSEIPTIEKLVTGIFHEGLGHYGLRGAFGNKLDSILTQIVLTRRGEVTAKVKEYGLDMGKKEHRLIAAEEILAEMAQTRPEIGFVRRAIAAIKTWLREKFTSLKLHLTDDEIIRSILMPARKFVEQGHAAGVDKAAPAFHRAYHGTPHDFEKFDSSKIGTGEGNQAYGHGLYFAGKREVAEYYQRTTSGTPFIDPETLKLVRDAYATAQFEGLAGLQATTRAKNIVHDKAVASENPYRKKMLFDAMNNLQEFVGKPKGSLFEVELAPKEHEYLDWDKPLRQQSEGVRKALKEYPLPDVATGAQIYDMLKNRAMSAQEPSSRRGLETYGAEASAALQKAGIPGIRYLDGSSRHRSLRQIKQEFLAELPEDADFEEVLALIGTGRFSPENEAILKALAADDWLGFDYPAQAISATLGPTLTSNFDPSPSLLKAVQDAQSGGTHNYVIFDDKHVEVTAKFARHKAPIDPNEYGERVAQIKGSSRSIAEHVSDLFHSDKSFGWWHKTIGTQYHKSQVDRDFKRVYDKGQDYLHEFSRAALEAADQAPHLLPKIEGFRGVVKSITGAAKTADVKAIQKPLMDGTLQAENGNPHEGRVWTDAQLRAQYGLTDTQIGLYREARKAIDTSLDELHASEVANLTRDYLGRDILDRIRQDPAHAGEIAGDALAEKAEAIDKQISELLKENGKGEQAIKLQGKAREMIDLATLLVEKQQNVESLKVHGYAPLMRFGKFSVSAYEQDDEGKPRLIYFSLHESQSEANAAKREVGKLFPNAEVRGGVKNDEAFTLYQGLTPDTLELFAHTLGIGQDSVFQQYLKVAKNTRSAFKRLIHRKGTAGFEVDPVRSLAAFITSNARAVAGNWHMGELTQAATDIPQEKGDVGQEAARLVKYLQNPNEEAPLLRNYLFIQYLGGSLASAMVNMTQPLTMTYPYLAQYGAKRAGAELSLGMAQALMADSVLEPELRKAVHRGEQDGVVAPHEIHQLHAEAMRHLGSNIWVRRTLTAWGSLFAAAEGFNRRSTFIAAYRIGKQDGVADPYAFAVKAVEETQGVYNRGNRPNWSRGAVGATIFTFKQFSISYIEFLKRLPPREKMIALAIMFALAGSQGLPFAEDIEDLLDTIAQALGYSFNTRQSLRHAATKALGKEGANFVMHGASHLPGVPLDVQGRLGMGNLIPGSSVAKRSLTPEQRLKEALQVLGPVGGLIGDVSSAVQGAFSGDAKEMLKALPLVGSAAIQNVLKGVDMWQTGMYRDSKGKKVMDTTKAEAIIKGIGFQPQSVAAESKRVSENMQNISLHKQVEAKIAGDWASGRFELALAKDDTQREAAQKKIDEARKDLVDWNRKNPEAVIRIDPSQIRNRVREMRLSREQRIIKHAPREIRRGVREEMTD